MLWHEISAGTQAIEGAMIVIQQSTDLIQSMSQNFEEVVNPNDRVKNLVQDLGQNLVTLESNSSIPHARQSGRTTLHPCECAQARCIISLSKQHDCMHDLYIYRCLCQILVTLRSVYKDLSHQPSCQQKGNIKFSCFYANGQLLQFLVCLIKKISMFWQKLKGKF